MKRLVPVLLIFWVLAMPLDSVAEFYKYVDENGVITSTVPDPTKKKQIAAEDIEIKIPSKEPSEKQDPIREGTLTSFFESRGFGFISDSVTKERIFVHANNMIDEILNVFKFCFII